MRPIPHPLPLCYFLPLLCSVAFLSRNKQENTAVMVGERLHCGGGEVTLWWGEIESLISESIFKLELQIQCFGDHCTQSILPYLYASPYSGNLITGVI